MQTFSPFPLRARGSLEIFDAAIKLYKQYFWVLLGWSAIVSGASVFGSIVPLGGLAALFLTPLSVGSVVCCVAAAVRGHNVEFGQCWRFTQPRYWMMLGMHLVASIIGFIVLGILVALCTALVVAGAFGFQSSPLSVQIVMGVLAFVILGVAVTIIGTVFFSWVSLVPIVVCMEEDKRGMMALGRAYDLLKGHWIRITALMAIVGLGMLALFAILAGLATLVVGVGALNDLLQGRGESSATLWLTVAAMGLAYIVLLIACTPLYYLILTTFYLDIRVRQEALDLEWTAHLTTPVAPIQPIMPDFIATAPAQEYSASGFSPAQITPLQTPETPPANPFATRLLSDEGSTPGAPPPEAPTESSPERPSNQW